MRRPFAGEALGVAVVRGVDMALDMADTFLL
jgi:hypothetical protein